MASQPKILVVGKNVLIRSAFQDLLVSRGEFEVDVIADANQLPASSLTAYSAVLVFVDSLDDLDFTVEKPQALPPMMLLIGEEQKTQLPSRHKEQAHWILFLQPFSFQEVFIQLQGIVTRYEIKRQVSFRLGDVVVDPSSLTITNAFEETKKLTQKEFELLYILYKAKGKTLSREYLLKEVWGYKRDIITNTLDTHIHWLRQKIESDSSSPQIIVTDDRGYQITPEHSSQNN